MAETELYVYMGGVLAGVLRQHPTGRLTFAYDSVYQADPRSTPLSHSMPFDVDRHKPSVVANFFFGLLPDNDRTLEAWARKYGVSARNPFGLLKHVGRDTAGALQILPPGMEPADSVEPNGDIEWLTASELQKSVASLREPNAGWEVVGRAGHWSLAGAQNKLALHHGDGRWGIPRDSTPTTHILKATISGFPDHDLNEYACLNVASALGLTAATTSIERFGPERALVSRRYDRAFTRSGGWRRIHQEDLCQAFGLSPSLKYQKDGGPSPRKIAGLLREVGGEAPSRFFDQLNHNVAIGATDAHAKNYSVLMLGDVSVLAPLYDVASFLPYARGPVRSAGLREDGPTSAMRIGKNNEFAKISEQDFIDLGKALGVVPDDAVERFRRIRQDCSGHFGQIADSFAGRPDEKAFLRGLAGLVDRQCRQQLNNSRPS